MHDTQFFVVNPYLLVLTSSGNKVNALLPYSDIAYVEYSHNKIEVNYRGQSARKWLYYINEYYPDHKGIMRLWFVNAYDAGFTYAHVDMSRSANIEPALNSQESVARGLYAVRELFHVGHLAKNNISPYDARAVLKLKRKNAKTLIYVKLWKSCPANINAKENFAYVITIEP